MLLTVALFITISIYCCLIKHKAKQKHLLPLYVTNNKLKEICINELKEIDIKSRTCYYFDDIMREIYLYSCDTLVD